jgi:16S rRNA (guanine527-N7)-methyltransferase
LRLSLFTYAEDRKPGMPDECRIAACLGALRIGTAYAPLRVFHVKLRTKSLPYPSPGKATVALPWPNPLTPDVEAKLDDFAHLLARWSSRINLVADARMDVIRHRHIQDSLQIVPLLPQTDCLTGDLGTGGGFPGLVLAIATGRPTHLVESDHRKTAFLIEAAARLSLHNVTIHTARIEDANLPPLHVVTARALATLDVLLGYAARLLRPGGVAIFPKGRQTDAELTAAAAQWKFRVERFASRSSSDGTILRITDIEAR